MSNVSDNGVMFSYHTSRTYNGDPQPALLVYALYGTNKQCGLPSTIAGWIDGTPSTTGYSAGNINASGNTLCYIHIAGPSS